MLCNSCGGNNPDGSAYCNACGKQLPSEAQANSAPAKTQKNQKAKQAQSAFAKQFNVAWRKMFASPLALAFNIVYSILLLFAVDLALNPLSALGDLAATLGVTCANASDVSILMLAYLLPGIAIAIGMWMQYAEARGLADTAIQTSGLALIKNAVIIGTGMIGLGIAILLLNCCYMEPAFYQSEAWVVLFFSLLAGVILVAGYLILLIKIISDAKEAADSASPCSDLIKILAIVQLVLGVIATVAVLLVFSPSWASILGIAALFMSACILLQYKSTMDNAQSLQSRIVR